MTMKMTDRQALERLENLDPDDAHVRDRSAVGAVAEAAADRRRAEDNVANAVEKARADGVTWTEIGIALGVSHQAAIKRYGKTTH